MFYRTASACLLCLGAAASSFADSVLEFQTTEFSGGKAIIGTVQISTSGSNARVEIISVSSAEAGGLIFRGDRNELIILNHAQGSYVVIDRERMNAIGAQASGSAAQKGQRRQTDVITSLGSHGQVAGIRCRNYEVVRAGRKIRELCVSDWDDIPGGHDTANALESVVDFFEAARRESADAGGMDVFDRQRELFGYMREVDGYPILDRDFSARGALERQTLLTSARKETLSPGFFEPPKRYKNQESVSGAN